MEALGINAPGLITSIVSFTLLFAILYFLLYKPLLRVMDDRSAKIKESLDTAQTAREEAQRSREDMEKKIGEARVEGQAMIAQAREVAERFREEELAKARQEIEAQRQRAAAEIQREKSAAIEELRGQFAGLAITAAERVVRESVDEAAHSRLIEQVLEESTVIRGRS